MKVGKWLFEKISQFYAKETKDIKRSYLCDFGRICHEVIPGDVLLVEGTNRISRHIKWITQSPWTHAALYIGRIHSIEDEKTRALVEKYYQGKASDQLLIDTIVGQGTFIRPLTEYQRHHLRICRPTGISQQDAQKVINFAASHLGRAYNTRQFIDLARFVLANRWFIPKRWRSSLFKHKPPSDTAKDICSSLIADAFNAIKFPILPYVRPTDNKQGIEYIRRNTKLYTPADFDYSPYFSIIKYPFYRYTDQESPYQYLPWREDLVSHDEGVISETEEPSPKE